MNKWKIKIRAREKDTGKKSIMERRKFNYLMLRGGAKNNRIIHNSKNIPSLMKYRWAERAFRVREVQCKTCKNHTVLEWLSPFVSSWSKHPFPEECVSDLTKFSKTVNPYTPQINAARYVLEQYLKEKGYAWVPTNSGLKKRWNDLHPPCQQTTQCKHKGACKNPKQMHANDILNNIWMQRNKLQAGSVVPLSKCQKNMPKSWRVLDVFSGQDHFVQKYLRYDNNPNIVNIPQEQNPINIISSFKNIEAQLEESYRTNKSYQTKYKDKLGWALIRSKRPDPSCMEYVKYSTWAGHNPCEENKAEHSLDYQTKVWNLLDMELRKRKLGRVEPPKTFGHKCKVCGKKHFIHKIQNTWDYSLKKAKVVHVSDRDMYGNAKEFIDTSKNDENNIREIGMECIEMFNDILHNWSDVLNRFYSLNENDMHSIYAKSTCLFENLFDHTGKAKGTPTSISKDRLDFDKSQMRHFFSEKINILKQKICHFRHEYKIKNNYVGFPVIENNLIVGLLIDQNKMISFEDEKTLRGKQRKSEIITKVDFKKVEKDCSQMLFMNIDAMKLLDCAAYNFNITGTTDGMTYQMVKESNDAVKKHFMV